MLDREPVKNFEDPAKNERFQCSIYLLFSSCFLFVYLFLFLFTLNSGSKGCLSVLVRPLKSSILSSTTLQMDKTF